MDTYLTIMVTILVLTQVIRITQNTIQLHRQSKLICKQLDQIKDVTDEDFDIQRKAYHLIVKHLEDDSDDIIHCKDCANLTFSDCYGECGKGYLGIVSPNDSCGRGKAKEQL